MTRDELQSLPAVLDVPTAAAVLGVGRTLAYELVRTGRWPSPVLRMGRLVKIPSAPLLRLLDQPPTGNTVVGLSTGSGPAAGAGASASVSRS